MNDREDLSRLVALADQAKAHNFRPDTEAGRDALADLWAAVDSVRASGAQGELELGPQGHRYAWCPECGELTRPNEVDPEGCCYECGCTAVGPGIDALVDRYNREVVLSARRLAAARTMRDHARALMRALGSVRTSMVFKCLYCGLETEVASDMVAHGETCEKHPAVVRLKAILAAEAEWEDALFAYQRGLDEPDAAEKIHKSMETYVAKRKALDPKPEPVKDGAL